DGVQFDIDGDGRLDQTAFVAGKDAFLGLDRNGNGVIDSGSELFGDQHGAANGFLELSRYDADGNGIIDSRDPVFSSLLGIGRDSANKLRQFSLAEAGVTAISLESTAGIHEAQGGNTMTQTGTYDCDAGQRLCADVLLNYRVA